MGYFETCKAKGIKLSLSWAQGRYWKKKVAGKQLYFKTANTASGYQAALTEWAKSQELPEPPDPNAERPLLRRIVEWYEQNGDPEGRVEHLRKFLDAKYVPAEEEFALPIRMVGTPTEEIVDLMFGESYAKDELANRRLWKDRLEQPVKKGLKIDDAVKRFLADQLQLVQVGKRKPSTYGTWADRLKHVQNQISGSVEAINSNTLTNFHRALLANDLIGGQRQANIFKAFKSFVRWAWQEELLVELPRNLNKSFEFTDDSQDYAWMLYSQQDIKSMMAQLPARGRAAVLLGLNCGFTFGDLADLKKTNVDLKAGRLVYKRVKTRRRKRTPTINYKIWPETIGVLKECQSDHPELWFLTEDGLPLKSSEIVDDRESKWSVLSKQWSGWKKSGYVPKKPQKGLRKTGATTIEATYPGWEQMYLGQAPTTVAGRHYIVKEGQVNPEFDKIMDWLREQVMPIAQKPVQQ